jgi:large subunit ribosomal protein L11
MAKKVIAQIKLQIPEGTIIPVLITVYADRSFTFVTKTPPASVLLKQAAQLAKGAKETGKERAGQITRAQLQEIAKQKMPDLNTTNLEAAMSSIAGTARSMGIEITE